jgi:restriction system protein
MHSNFIESILKQTVAHSYVCDWESLKRFDSYKKPPPVPEEIQPKASPPPVVRQPYIPTFWEKLVPQLVRKRRQHNEIEYRTALVNWQQENSRIHEENLKAKRDIDVRHELDLKLYSKAEAQHQQERANHNQMVDQRRALYFSGDPEALCEYWYSLFSDLPYPDQWPQECSLEYRSESKLLLVDYELPSMEIFLSVKEVRYIAAKKRIQRYTYNRGTTQEDLRRCAVPDRSCFTLQTIPI